MWSEDFYFDPSAVMSMYFNFQIYCDFKVAFVISIYVKSVTREHTLTDFKLL